MSVLGIIRFLISIITPFIIGGAIAFILNIPMAYIENKWFKNWNGKIGQKLKRPLSCTLSVIIILTLIVLIVVLVISQLRKTTIELANTIPNFLDNCKNQIVEWLKNLQSQYPELEKFISSLNSNEFNWSSILNNILSFLKNGLGDILQKTASTTGTVVSAIVDMFIAIVFAIYILVQKETLSRQCKSLFHAFLPRKKYNLVMKVSNMLSVNFRNFITGQCAEAIILGSMFVFFMSIFRFPYAVFVGVVIAFTALIPIVGAFIGCGIGLFLLVMENPTQAFWFLIMFFVLQQIEGNFIYPKVVGNSVGLPAMWVLFAVSIGASLMGVSGMLLFIPLTSTVYTLLQTSVRRRNRIKARRKRLR